MFLIWFLKYIKEVKGTADVYLVVYEKFNQLRSLSKVFMWIICDQCLGRVFGLGVCGILNVFAWVDGVALSGFLSILISGKLKTRHGSGAKR